MSTFYVFGALFVLTFVVSIYKLQFFIIYPSNFPEGSRTEVDSPAEYEMQFEDVRLATTDGEALQAYILTPPQEKPGSSNARKTVLMLGPNAGNIGLALPLAKVIYSAGFNIVMLSYRGYGKSTGSPSEVGLKTDARSAIDFIKGHEKLGSTEIVLYGRSLGGAVAIYLASEFPDKIHSVVLENTFLSIPKLVPSVMPVFKIFAPFLTEKWRSELLIPEIDKLPILFLGGAKDEIVPPQHFYKLYELCKSPKKQFKLLPNGTHNDTVIQVGYFETLLKFLAM